MKKIFYCKSDWLINNIETYYWWQIDWIIHIMLVIKNFIGYKKNWKRYNKLISIIKYFDKYFEYYENSNIIKNIENN